MNSGQLLYGYGEKFDSYRENSVFQVAIGALERPPQTLLHECMEHAKQIKERHSGQKLMVALSGGVDSECVLRSFALAGVEVSAGIMSFSHGLNHYEVEVAKKLCHELDVSYQVFEVCPYEFLKSKIHLQYAKDYRLNSPQIAFHVHLAERMSEIGGVVPIFAGDLLIFRSARKSPYLSTAPAAKACEFNGEGYWSFGESIVFINTTCENHFTLYKRFADLGRPIVGNFFLSSPSLVAAAAKISATLNLDREIDKINFEGHKHFRRLHFLQMVKNNVLRLGGFEPFNRRFKWTGFELLHLAFAHSSFKTEKDYSRMSPEMYWDKQIDGMNIFNELYRRPMKKIARQLMIQRLLFAQPTYEYILEQVNQSSPKRELQLSPP